MQVVNKKMCVIVILVLVIIESCTLFLMYKSYGNKNTNLDEVNLNINNANMFAIMLEQEDGTYKEDKTSTWPTSGYTYNASMSGCIDINGNKLDGVLSYDATNNIATVDTGNTSYCYLYFSLPADNLYDLCKNYTNVDECIKKEINNIEYVNGFWDSSLEDDGYRYVGTNPNNYVCFGTTDKNTCTGNTDLYMYRIIGIFEDTEGNEHLKLIKKEALNTAYAWNSSYTTDADWDESDLYKGINGSYFLTNPAYSYMQDNNWINKIINWEYTATNTLAKENYNLNGTYGIDYYYDNLVSTIYLHELNRNTKSEQICYYNKSTTADCSVGEWKKVTDKIGLVYVSDYLLSLGMDSLSLMSYTNRTTLKTGWMHLSNNDSNTLSTSEIEPPKPDEWTMSRYGALNSSIYTAYAILATNVSYAGVAAVFSVRPVFYLTFDIKIISGNGTSSNPFILG
ncbi:MAG: hypothetical protein IJY87_00175 [Bacilli bacterium]|nr:hypothetical protein [Bacilli bacterium]